MSNLTNFGGCVQYAFQVIDNGDGTVHVRDGGVNNYLTNFVQLSGKPTEIWMEVAFTEGDVTAVTLDTSSGTTDEDSDWRLIATITWALDVPTITQSMGGGQNIGSCGPMHQWTAIYFPYYSYYY